VETGKSNSNAAGGMILYVQILDKVSLLGQITNYQGLGDEVITKKCEEVVGGIELFYILVVVVT
jgi:hypothetical protein